MNLFEKAMNSSEKRILKLAIILFTIGLTVRYLPWGLPSIETFEVGDAVVVANALPGETLDSSRVNQEKIFSPERFLADSFGGANKINVPGPQTMDVTDSGELAPAERGFLSREKGADFPKKHKKKVELPLHINSASIEDLCALKGVGPKLAEKIIVRRNTFGPFKGPSDLKKVHGIGKKKIENMLQSIIFD